MSCPVNYRNGLDATSASGAGPAGSVEQEAADLPLQAWSHLTPLTAPHDACWEVGETRGRIRQIHISGDVFKLSAFSGTNN